MTALVLDGNDNGEGEGEEEEEDSSSFCSLENKAQLLGLGLTRKLRDSRFRRFPSDRKSVENSNFFPSLATLCLWGFVSFCLCFLHKSGADGNATGRHAGNRRAVKQSVRSIEHDPLAKKMRSESKIQNRALVLL